MNYYDYIVVSNYNYTMLLLNYRYLLEEVLLELLEVDHGELDVVTSISTPCWDPLKSRMDGGTRRSYVESRPSGWSQRTVRMLSG